MIEIEVRCNWDDYVWVVCETHCQHEMFDPSTNESDEQAGVIAAAAIYADE